MTNNMMLGLSLVPTEAVVSSAGYPDVELKRINNHE